MNKALLSIAALCCLAISCSSDSDADSNHDEIGSDTLIATKSEITLYYDIPATVKLRYQGNIELKVTESNNCIDILTDPLITNSKGVANLQMAAKVFTCDEPRLVKICDAQNNEMCVELMVRTTSKEDEIDKNHNLMIDEYETNSDKDAYKTEDYVPGDCSTFCHDDADCDDFCDSAIGSICSTRCTSDDQCIKFSDNNEWVSLVCRDDGRCAYPYFKAVFTINKDNTTLTFGGKPLDDKATIDWGDGTGVMPIPADTNNNLSHEYKKAGKYNVSLYGDFVNWIAGCNEDVELFDIYQFGKVGLGYDESSEHGSFWDCFSFNRISAKDIPDASKLTDMSFMFAGNGTMKFNHNHITRWDTSNVVAMNMTFLNAGEYTSQGGVGFNQDLGKWNTSKVKSMAGTFFCAQVFNQDIGCWDVSKVKSISSLFGYNVRFTQSLDDWNLVSCINHDAVFTKPSGKPWDIGLKAYCTLTNKLNNEDIGRNNTQCWKEYTYKSACTNDAWKKKYYECEDALKAKYPDITEDTVICSQIIGTCDQSCFIKNYFDFNVLSAAYW